MIGRGEAGNVEREHGVRRVAQFGHRHVEHVAVDQPRHAELFDDRDEGTGRDDVAVVVAHAQQAFVFRHLVGLRLDDRLIGEQQAVLAHRLLDLGADIHGAPVQQALLFRRP